MILLTGGTGYIGSHMLLALLEAGHQVLVLDNLCNSRIEALRRVEQITGRTAAFIQGDIRDASLLDDIFARFHIDSVMHFAGLKSVATSVQQPLKYFDNNITGSNCLFLAMQRAGIAKLVFSSSATVYGEPETLPISEAAAINVPANPYGYTKLAIEQMLMQWAEADPDLSVAALRYFNPVGAHASGRIGEDPQGTPNNLLPYMSQVAVGQLAQLAVFGDDYATSDGTGVRDYIHVMDLVAGHLKALSYLTTHTGYHVWNLGAGTGYSVLQMVKAFEQASGTAIPYVIQPRRAGDIAACYADASKAKQELDWVAMRGLDEMMKDSWRWQSQNPLGYSNS